MEWTKFKNKMVEYDVPILVYKPKKGVYNYFKKDDDIRICKLISKRETSHGLYYNLEGYDYGNCGNVTFNELDFLELMWVEIPRP
jgi:hypothetical protein